ncbi:hypothetical protein J8A87_24320 [Vibrio parahaemolyticus]|uniref:DUF3718 domain-containing protein n=1 Tax=Vibrio vulnificus TaxID=672 RepID=A0AAN1UF83_VIBVL|nr:MULTISPECIES: hypothetical protein [Vibrio]EGR5855684.1 hypothetical protein [Vibrio parahaemolyticus]AXX63295.1 hypothetical protein FORC53_4956 [Vibrio vulnificus]ELA8198067.1 hypothetical protein [Vibrio parahaemolyticus]MBE4779294.1 hypothetical protein [Vibrio parahaemolyticus]MCF9167568.1 hypothetical protein [Vibrio parahaemolyticus]
MKVNKVLMVVLATISLNVQSATYEMERVDTYYAVKSDHVASVCFNLARESLIQAGLSPQSALREDIYNTCMSKLSKLDTFTAKRKY